MIQNIKGIEILDSRGNPTVEISVEINGIIGHASVPSGASVGIHEAVELRDKNLYRYHGKGVQDLIHKSENGIFSVLKYQKFDSITALDQAIIDFDNNLNKSTIGANISLGLSLAFARCLAKLNKIPLYKIIAEEYNFINTAIPQPMFNVINGGKHADNKLPFQEFMITVFADNINDMIRRGAEFFYDLKLKLKDKNYNVNVGDEGGFAPQISTVEETLDILTDLIITKYNDVKIALDVAASTFYNHSYQFTDKNLSSNEMIEYYQRLIYQYPIISIEDPLDENDTHGWRDMIAVLGDKINIIGDDIFVTNVELLKQNIHLANGIIIKPNQIGTLTETINTIKYAQNNNYTIIVSHRSGETEDTTIAHLATAIASDYIKAGSLCRSERVSKYNELIRINKNFY